MTGVGAAGRAPRPRIVVEQRDILDLLITMGCDIAQGFAIGRPMSLESLTKWLSADRKRSVA